jgi:hypothetical protein
VLLEAVAVLAAAAPPDELAEDVPAAPPEAASAVGALPEAVAVALRPAAPLPDEPFPDD